MLVKSKGPRKYFIGMAVCGAIFGIGYMWIVTFEGSKDPVYYLNMIVGLALAVVGIGGAIKSNR